MDVEALAMNERRSLLTTAGTLAAVLFGAGLAAVFLVPGGGTVTEDQFTSFYDSSGKPATAFLLYVALVAGSGLMAWFFGELRDRIGSTPGTDYAQRVAWLGAGGVIVGGGIELAPAGVQLNSDSSFVGMPIAQSFAQAGLLVFVMGIYAFAVAVFLSARAARRAGAVPGWVGTSGMVVAVLLLASYIVAPAVLLPLWVLVTALGSRSHRAAAVGARKSMAGVA
jgi:hypothetical protein